MFLKRLLGASDRPSTLPRLPSGERVYAIGDVHGCSALLRQLLDKIDCDERKRGASRTTIVFLGDLIDRGPDSCGVIEAVLALANKRVVRSVAGNHEEMLLASLGSDEVLSRFLKFGGRETVLSYPIAQSVYTQMSIGELRAVLPQLIPAQHLHFLQRMEDYIVLGDYVFVHAGLRPGVPLNEQVARDLRWIRNGFLDFEGNFEGTVVHGHTITEAPEMRHNRIAIDTGAYVSGKLTALGLEGSERWLLTAEA